MPLRCRARPAEAAAAHPTGHRSRAALSAELSGAPQEKRALNQGVGKLQVGELWVTDPACSSVVVIVTLCQLLGFEIETCGRMGWF